MILQSQLMESADLSSEREEELAALGAGVAEEYSPGDELVDPAAIAKEIGITLSYGDYGGCFDGLLEYQSGRFHIYCNTGGVKSPNDPKARFTVAHELGHFHIDEHRLAMMSGLVKDHRSFSEFTSGARIEREADFFASHLLMPGHQFKKRLSKTTPDLNGVLTISDHFKTSWLSTALRFVTDDVAPCMIVIWGPNGERSWGLGSASFAQQWRGGIIKTLGEMNQVGATESALKCEAHSRKVWEKPSLMSAWSTYIRQGASNDLILNEQAVRRGKYGVLTLLTITEQPS